MKDKRQKMTLTWPCGDPILAAYVLQAAAASGQLPYPFFAAAAASSPFGLLPPRPPPPPHPFSLNAAGMPCRPTPTLIPPPQLVLGDRKSPDEVLSEDEAKTVSEASSTANSASSELTITTTTAADMKDRSRPSCGSLFQPYLDIGKN
jgi:hypothetical protein